jgi:hypothetical protein
MNGHKVDDAETPWYSRWQALAGAMLVSCVMVLVSHLPFLT